MALSERLPSQSENNQNIIPTIPLTNQLEHEVVPHRRKLSQDEFEAYAQKRLSELPEQFRKEYNLQMKGNKLVSSEHSLGIELMRWSKVWSNALNEDGSFTDDIYELTGRETFNITFDHYFPGYHLPSQTSSSLTNHVPLIVKTIVDAHKRHYDGQRQKLRDYNRTQWQT